MEEPDTDGRNVWLHDYNGGLVGGMWLSGSITHGLFLDMVRIITVMESEYSVHHHDGEILGPKIQRDSQTLALEHYVILALDGSLIHVHLNNKDVHS